MFQLFTFLLLALNVSFSVSYFITVDAHAEECFFDKVETGTKMGKSNVLLYVSPLLDTK